MMIDRFELFSSEISSLYHYIQKIERDEMVRLGLKGAHAQYLVAMLKQPEGVTATRLCEICDKDKAAVSRAITELESAGLILRDGDTKTSYRVPLKLTEKGQRIAETVSELANLAVEKAGLGLSDEHRAIFYASLNLIAGNLQRLSEEGLGEQDDKKAP